MVGRNYPLFEHMDEEHGLTLTEDQLWQIERIVLKMHNIDPEKCTTETAMQEYIYRLKKRRSSIQEAYKPLRHLQNVNDLMNMLVEQITIDIELAESMLEKERGQIINAYREGCSDSILDESTDDARAEQHYNETYGEQ